MPNINFTWLIIGVLLGFFLRHIMRGRTAVTS